MRLRRGLAALCAAVLCVSCAVPVPAADQLVSDDSQALVGPVTASLGDRDIVPAVADPQPTLPVTVTSADGVEVEVDDTSRILAVDLYGTLAEIVFGLGLGDRVVARDSSTGFPSAQHLPVVTPGGHDLNAEAILDLDPTVVLTDTSIGPPEVQQQLREAGVDVVFFAEDRSLGGVPARIRGVAETLGVPDAGEALVAQFEQDLRDAAAVAPDLDEPLRVAFLYVRGTAGVYLLGGPGSGADDLIEAVGAVDVGTELGLERPFTPLTSESMIAAAPDVLLVMSGGLESVRGIDGLLQLPGIAQTPAAEHRRVVDMADTDLLSFGPRSGRVVAALADALYREAEE